VVNGVTTSISADFNSLRVGPHWRQHAINGPGQQRELSRTGAPARILLRNSLNHPITDKMEGGRLERESKLCRFYNTYRSATKTASAPDMATTWVTKAPPPLCGHRVEADALNQFVAVLLAVTPGCGFTGRRPGTTFRRAVGNFRAAGVRHQMSVTNEVVVTTLVGGTCA
jgi:hypothetical protein